MTRDLSPTTQSRWGKEHIVPINPLKTSLQQERANGGGSEKKKQKPTMS